MIRTAIAIIWIILGLSLSVMANNLPTSSLATRWVTLDGYNIILVAGPSEVIQRRVRNIEQQLHRILAVKTPQTLHLIDKRVNQELVLLVEHTPNIPIATITNLDRSFYSQPETEILSMWKNQIESGLQRGWKERTIKHIWNQTWFVLGILILAIASNFMISTLTKRSIHQSKQYLTQPPTTIEPNQTNDSQPSAIANLRIWNQELKNLTDEYRVDRQQLLLRTLRWIQISIWFITICSTLLQFPQTRTWGIWLLDRPIKLFFVWVGIIFLIKAIDLIIDLILKSKTEGLSFEQIKWNRNTLRFSTLGKGIKGLLRFILIIIGIISTLEFLNISIIPLLATGAIITFAVTWSSQNIIKDLINGIFILIEDQFVITDLVNIGNLQGVVEKINLRITQIRTINGQLITIPNGTITSSKNLSRDWSRIFIKITINHEENINQVMELMNLVAVQLYHDPQWGQIILETPQLLGIETIHEMGVVICLTIKTHPQEQFRVSREYLHRLKELFESQGIMMTPCDLNHILMFNNKI